MRKSEKNASDSNSKFEVLLDEKTDLERNLRREEAQVSSLESILKQVRDENDELKYSRRKTDLEKVEKSSQTTSDQESTDSALVERKQRREKEKTESLLKVLINLFKIWC